MILTNGQRAGFFIGDAAGVGKGRQVLYLDILGFYAIYTYMYYVNFPLDLTVIFV